jgi:hypothetical protein
MTAKSAILYGLATILLPSVSSAQGSACELFACAFLAFETADGKALNDSTVDVVQTKEFQIASELLDRGTLQAASALRGATQPPLPSMPCIVFAGSVGDTMFKVGRAYEFEARRTLNLIRDANINSQTAFDRLQCSSLIGDNP